MKWLAYIFLAPWLGHGRATEALMCGFSLVYAAVLMPEAAAFDSQATREIALAGYGQFLLVPFLVHGVVSGVGLLLNINGCCGSTSRWLRFIAAMMFCYIGIWFAAQFIQVGAIGAFGFPFAVVAPIFSMRTMVMAILDLPRPGAPGAL